MISGFEDLQGFEKRIQWLCNEELTKKFFVEKGNLHIKVPCTKLHYDAKTKLYSCAVHDSPERPTLCKIYPDTVPVWDWKKEAEDCPIIKEKLALICENSSRNDKP